MIPSSLIGRKVTVNSRGGSYEVVAVAWRGDSFVLLLLSSAGRLSLEHADFVTVTP